ncbi:Glutamine amidotransferase chain of NAD synthetase [hydrothermal vent metagenome]|uniref:Glutamine amidotransferase chain of NAD synthetase n=1 Tax=hydrothermal vent metagenome TaxID=652676 RepID=A0A1W1D304_9ZZZZ
MVVTLVQNAPRLNRSNLEKIVAIIDEYKEKSDLIIFPELALNGYLLQDKLYEDAWELSELDVLAQLSDDVDIVVGGAIREKEHFRNSALYFSQGKLISQHNKVYLPNYGMFEEARYFDAGEMFESFVVKEKKIAMLVCEDLWHADVNHQLSLENPDIIIVLVASPARGFEDDGLLIQEQWYALLKATALHTQAKVLFVNRVGFEDGLGFWGGSCIVDKNAKILYKLPKYKQEIAIFDI